MRIVRDLIKYYSVVMSAVLVEAHPGVEPGVDLGASDPCCRCTMRHMAALSAAYLFLLAPARALLVARCLAISLLLFRNASEIRLFSSSNLCCALFRTSSRRFSGVMKLQLHIPLNLMWCSHLKQQASHTLFPVFRHLGPH